MTVPFQAIGIASSSASRHGSSKPLADVASGGEHDALTVAIAAGEPLVRGTVLGTPHVAVQGDELAAVLGQALGQPLQVLASFGQHDRATPLCRQLKRVPRDHLGASLVCDERGVDLLDVGIGGKCLRIEGRIAAHDAQHERLR